MLGSPRGAGVAGGGTRYRVPASPGVSRARGGQPPPPALWGQPAPHPPVYCPHTIPMPGGLRERFCVSGVPWCHPSLCPANEWPNSEPAGKDLGLVSGSGHGLCRVPWGHRDVPGPLGPLQPLSATPSSPVWSPLTEVQLGPVPWQRCRPAPCHSRGGHPAPCRGARLPVEGTKPSAPSRVSSGAGGTAMPPRCCWEGGTSEGPHPAHGIPGDPRVSTRGQAAVPSRGPAWVPAVVLG